MTEHWYHQMGGKQFGPFSFKGLRERVSFGILHPSDEVMLDGAAEWTEAANVPGLFERETNPRTPKQTLHEEPPKEPTMPGWLIPVLCLLGGIVVGMGLMAIIYSLGGR